MVDSQVFPAGPGLQHMEMLRGSKQGPGNRGGNQKDEQEEEEGTYPWDDRLP